MSEAGEEGREGRVWILISRGWMAFSFSLESAGESGPEGFMGLHFLPVAVSLSPLESENTSWAFAGTTETFLPLFVPGGAFGFVARLTFGF